MLIDNRSITLDDIRAPSSNTIVFSICACDIYSLKGLIYDIVHHLTDVMQITLG